ncbi:MAG: DUF2380 domain-containing protein [Polyangiaceae bacterium]
MDVYLEQFSKRALEILDALLDQSKERVEREEEQYGLRREEGQSGRGGAEGAPGFEEQEEVPGGSASMDPSVRTAGLIGAAKELLAKDKQIRALEAEQFRLRPKSDRLWGREPPNPRLAELGKEISHEKRKLRILHEGYQAKYPVLGAFMENDLEHAQTQKLIKLASSKSSDSDIANILLVEIESRLKDIEKVRKAAGKTLPIWQLPKVVAITSSEKGVRKGTWQDAAVRTSVSDSDGAVADIALAVLGLALGVAGAALTGGLALAVAGVTIAIDLAEVAKDIQAYDLQKAAANTDFDRARAISVSEPSLFWVGLSLAGLVLDVGDAVRAFVELRRPIRAVMEASDTELDAAEEEVRLVANEHGAGEVAEELIATARAAKRTDSPRPAFEIAGGAKGFENEAIDQTVRRNVVVTMHLPSSALSNADLEAELEFLARAGLLEGEKGARVGKLGEHTWKESGLGQWCRYSWEALCIYVGEGPEADALRITNAVGAGARRRPRHHLFPQAKRTWFSERGFEDIDNFCVELEEAEHQAIHGGGDWRLAKRVWPDEWNRRVITELESAEDALGGRWLTRTEIINIVMRLKSDYKLTGPLVPYRDR